MPNFDFNQTLSASQARENFFQLLTDVVESGQLVRVRRRSGQTAVVLSEDELESWLETMEVLSDSELMQSIQKGMEDIRAGRVYSQQEADKVLGW